MAKKGKKKKMPKNKENIKQTNYLEILLKYSLRCIDGRSEETDSLFRNQANRIKDQIDKIEKYQ